MITYYLRRCLDISSHIKNIISISCFNSLKPCYANIRYYSLLRYYLNQWWNKDGTSGKNFSYILTDIPFCVSLWLLKSPAFPSFAQLLVQAPIEENIRAPRHWPLCGELIGEFPHKRPVTRKMFPFDDVIMIHILVVSDQESDIL